MIILDKQYKIKEICKINSFLNGVVKGVAAGKAVITAKYGGVRYVCNITVEAKKYGSVSGNITYFYNDFRGNVSDTGAIIILISKDGTAKNMPDLSYYVEWSMPSSINRYNDYGVYATKVDGTGKYSFNNVPVGDYKIVVLSAKTTSELAFENRDSYANGLADNVSQYINKTNASYLGKYVGYNKFKTDSISVGKGKDTYYGHDFGMTYI